MSHDQFTRFFCLFSGIFIGWLTKIPWLLHIYRRQRSDMMMVRRALKHQELNK